MSDFTLYFIADFKCIKCFIQIADLHCHPIGREGGIDKKARRKLIIASVLCVLFMLMEIVGGYMANSLGGDSIEKILA